MKLTDKNISNVYNDKINALHNVFAKEVDKVRNRIGEIEAWDDCQHTENRKMIADAVDRVIYKILTKY